eukprot:gb/GECH01008971.1/.p1 GENE.gb/GECH01008971.1/~~gb/GECH01008971.1/.p1  ORF type:complete len:404 (+),score=100.45 gb/GECH01008971.1/:1-1212(+)
MKFLETLLNKNHNDQTQKTIILFGGHQAGKTTLWKQFQLIYSHEMFSKVNNLRTFRSSVQQILLSCMQIVLKEFSTRKMAPREEDGEEQEAPRVDYSIMFDKETFYDDVIEAWKEKDKDKKYAFSNPNGRRYIRDILAIEQDSDITNGVVLEQIKELWQDYAVRKAYKEMESSSEYAELTPTSRYFLENIDRIAQKEYIPSIDDVLRCRTKSTGIRQSTQIVNGQQIQLIDAAGSKSERRKWRALITPPNTTNLWAVAFVVSLAEFDQVLYEDATTPRPLDSLRLFSRTYAMVAQMLTTEYSEQERGNRHFYVILNKFDEFAFKFTQNPDTFRSIFPNFSGETIDEALEFIKHEYDQHKLDDMKDFEGFIPQLRFFVISSVDTAQTEVLFDTLTARNENHENI